MNAALGSDYATVFPVIREQVHHDHLTDKGIIAVVYALQTYLHHGLVPDEQLAECRAFIGHCELELVMRQRDRLGRGELS